MDYEYSGTRWMGRWASQIAVSRAQPHGTWYFFYLFVFFRVIAIETTVHRVLRFLLYWYYTRYIFGGWDDKDGKTERRNFRYVVGWLFQREDSDVFKPCAVSDHFFLFIYILDHKSLKSLCYFFILLSSFLSFPSFPSFPSPGLLSFANQQCRSEHWSAITVFISSNVSTNTKLQQ